MTRRKALLVAGTLLVLLVVILGGIKLVEAIQGGNPDTEMTKSVARITYTGVVNGKTFHNDEWCTGSVVGDGWVLTALHCIYPGGIDTASVHLAGLRVQMWEAGVTSINTPDYSSGLILDDPSNPPVVTMLGGLTGSTFDYRDVALLHLAIPMPSWAKTIPMAPSWPAVGTTLTEYGYGRTSENGSVSNALQKSQQGNITRINCPSGQGWTSGHLCISSGGSSAWGGDSGGPLLWWNNGYWLQVGSLSGAPASNKTVRSFWSEADGDTRNWILSTVGAKFPIGTILRDPTSGTSWVSDIYGYRHWISDGKTYSCLVNNNGPKGAPLNLPLRIIEALPEDVGSPANCTPLPAYLATPTSVPPAQASPTPAPYTPPTPTSAPYTPPTPVPTWTEQEGSHGANSFVNPHNASGMGPRLDAMAYVQVSCKVYAPEITSVNPDGYWYRIASAPWNNGYYIAANTFWNGDVPGVYPYTHNTDWNVPNC